MEQKIKSKSFEDLRVWQKAQDLTFQVYGLTKTFPKEEMFGITSQLRRAVVSVPTNIAESQGRFSYADRNNFLITARGSLLETLSLIKTAYRLDYLSSQSLSLIEGEIAGLSAGLNALINSLRRR